MATLFHGLRRLWSDDDGFVLPYVTIMLVVLVGVGSLALDAARVVSLQTQLQHGADALALAGAAELDRMPDSITRATNAINNILAGAQANRTAVGMDGNTNVTATSIRFFTGLPDDVVAPIPNSFVTSDGVLARFVEVTVTPVNLSTILPIRFVPGVAFDTLTVLASATAGNDTVSCGITPMFVCNPFEQSGDTYSQATARLQAANKDPAARRKLIRMGDGDPAGTWGPGDFGYLIPNSGQLSSDACFPGGQEIARAMAQDRPLVCVRQNGINLLTGNTANARDGLNTRFGRYTKPLLNTGCHLTYPPDQNTRTAWQPAGKDDWCSGSPDGVDSGAGVNWPPGPNNNATGVDTCLIGNAPTCTPVANIGGSSWDCLTYWNQVHGPSGSTAPAGCTNAATISRYDVYRYEIDNSLLEHQSSPYLEKGAPQCTGTKAAANRRIMTVAIVNCGSSPVTIQAKAQNVPVAAFGRFFLTHQLTNQTKPYAEFIDLVERGDGSGLLYDQVQLYR